MKCSKIFMLICSLCIAEQLHAKSFSIMHPEYNQRQTDSASITLNGIVYVSGNKWVIWINEKRITPTSIPSWLKINKVTPTKIECEYKANSIWYQLTLEVFDTFTAPKTSVTNED